MTRLCIVLPAWLGGVAGGAAVYDDCGPNGICDAYTVDDFGHTVPLGLRTAPAVGRAVADHVRSGRLHPAVRAFAVAVLRSAAVAPTDNVGAAQALLSAVAAHVRYTPDAHRAEEIQSPALHLATRAGDCDDMAALVGALCEAVGLPCRVVMLRYATGDGAPGPADVYDHVYPEIDVALSGETDWRAADATLPATAGLPPDLGLDPATLAAVEARLVLDPYGSVPYAAGPSFATGAAPPPMFGLLNALAQRAPSTPTRRRPTAGFFDFFGGGPGGFDFGSGGGFDFGSGGGFDFGSGGGFDFGSGGSGFDFGPGGGFGGFSSNLFQGLDLGAAGGDPFAALGLGHTSQLDILGLFGQTRSERIQNIIATLLGLSAFLSIVFRDREAGRRDGVIYNPPAGEPPPPGYREGVDPETGERAWIPEDVLAREAAALEEHGMQQGGGLSLGTVALVAAAAGGAYYLAKRK